MSENTTILISKKARENIKEFGKKGETYNDIINKMYKELKLKQSIDVLMNTEGYLTVKEAREWTKNKNKIDSL
jgi:predicted CopG family antitoxin